MVCDTYRPTDCQMTVITDVILKIGLDKYLSLSAAMGLRLA